MGKQEGIELEYKIWLIEECLAGRMRGREAARRAGVGATTIRNWISRYRMEGADGLEPAGKKGKYSDAVKQKAVKDYLSGEGGLAAISEKYKIRSPGQILEWVKVYHRHREAEQETGGLVMAKKRQTTEEERAAIVKKHIDEGKSCSEIASEMGLNYRVVYDWVKKYKEKGMAGLEDRRGQRTAIQEPRTPEEELRVRIAQLERENHLLKLERDLLKKVKELERGEG